MARRITTNGDPMKSRSQKGFSLIELIVVVTITLFISLAVYGASGNFNLSG